MVIESATCSCGNSKNNRRENCRRGSFPRLHEGSFSPHKLSLHFHIRTHLLPPLGAAPRDLLHNFRLPFPHLFARKFDPGNIVPSYRLASWPKGLDPLLQSRRPIVREVDRWAAFGVPEPRDPLHRCWDPSVDVSACVRDFPAVASGKHSRWSPPGPAQLMRSCRVGTTFRRTSRRHAGIPPAPRLLFRRPSTRTTLPRPLKATLSAAPTAMLVHDGSGCPPISTFALPVIVVPPSTMGGSLGRGVVKTQCLALQSRRRGAPPAPLDPDVRGTKEDLVKQVVAATPDPKPDIARTARRGRPLVNTAFAPERIVDLDHWPVSRSGTGGAGGIRVSADARGRAANPIARSVILRAETAERIAAGACRDRLFSRLSAYPSPLLR